MKPSGFYLRADDLLLEKIIKGIKENVDIAVIGLSGGADSTLVASLCTLALGKEKVYGLSMPCTKEDQETFNTRSSELAEKLGINHINQSINEALIHFWNFQLVEGLPFPNALTLGNSRSRLRMVYLYAYANLLNQVHPDKRVRVMGTGNLSEDYIGYATKMGDMGADFFPIGQLYKQEVYDLLDYLVSKEVLSEDLIDRVPSAGLWPGQTDEKELGYTYNEMAPAIEFCMKKMDPLFKRVPGLISIKLYEGIMKTLDPDFKPLVEFVWGRHRRNLHKLTPPPSLDLRS